MKKVGLIRIDKMGDLINTIPIDQCDTFKGAQVSWAIAQGLKPFVDLAEPPRQVAEIPSKHWRPGLRALRQWLRKEKPETAVLFYGPWWASLALWLEKIPVRAGRRSQWHSFLFLNRTLRQSRSRSEMHEADYNLELVQKTLGGSGKPAPTLKLTAPLLPHLLEKYHLEPKKYFVVHPGMAGSAVNWPQEKYISVIRELLKHGTVSITGTAMDDESLTEIRKEFEKHPQVRWLQNQLDLPSLIYILAKSRSVLAPSTGVAHLAASLSVNTVSLFPNNRAQSPIRWSPRGDQVRVLDLESTRPENVVQECLRNP